MNIPYYNKYYEGNKMYSPVFKPTEFCKLVASVALFHHLEQGLINNDTPLNMYGVTSNLIQGFLSEPVSSKALMRDEPKFKTKNLINKRLKALK